MARKLVEKKNAIRWPEQRLEAYATVVWLQGIANGMEKCITYLHKLAGEAYQGEDDKRAQSMRAAANLLANLTKEHSRQWEKERAEYAERWNDEAEAATEKLPT